MSDLLRDYLLATGDSDILYIAKQEAAKEMERRKILGEHADRYSIRVVKECGRKPRFETYLPSNGHRKVLRRTSREALEDAIVEFYESRPDVELVDTVESVHDEWRKYRMAIKSSNTVNKDDWVWRSYYDGTELAGTSVDELTSYGITIALMKKVHEYGLSKKQFREMKSLLNGVLDYAVNKGLIKMNPAREIHGISPQLFRQEEKPRREDQIFEKADQKLFIDRCLQIYKNSGNTVYLGIILNFLLGVRVGELSAIKFSDIDEKQCVLHLQRSEVVKKVDNGGRMKNDGVVVMSHLKKGHDNRPVPLSKTAIDIIHMIRCVYAERGVETEWLLTNKNGKRVSKTAICDAIAYANKSIGLPLKNNHAIRKTVITEMIQSMMFTQKEIQTYFGHEDFSTTSRYYDFALNDTSENAAKMDRVLGADLGSWVAIG